MAHALAHTMAPSLFPAFLSEGLARVVYRSRAVRPMSGGALHRLTRDAQCRNAAESVTGIVLYDRCRFFQWLEGPVASLDRVMRSINGDARHTDIVVLSHRSVPQRTFGDWDLKLASDELPDGVGGPVAHPLPGTLAALRRAPDDAAELLGRLAPGPDHAAVLRDVLLGHMLPARARPGIPALVDRLLEFDVAGAAEMLGPYQAEVAEAAARDLGDRWADDRCSEAEVTLGLCCLRAAVRSPVDGWVEKDSPRVLSVPQPGELHALGPSLHGDAMRRAGWNPRTAAPANDADLAALVASAPFDCLDLSLSAAFVAADALRAVARTIANARRASCKPGLSVVVSGRATVDLPGLRTRVGADAVCRSAASLLDVVRRAVG